MSGKGKPIMSREREKELVGKKKVKTDLDKLKEILDHQNPAGVKSGDWQPLIYKIQISTALDNGELSLVIEELNIDFVFSRKGRLIGICNFKE